MQKQMNPKDSPAQTTSNGLLKAAKNRILIQGALAFFTIVIVVILLFAMTTAWYTNVVETSGLTFEAEAWGFEGEVVVQNETVKAVPGDSGVVDLTIVNKSDDVSAITVNVTKEFFPKTQLKQRVYFYVDEQRVVNGETVNKQYLSNTSGYTYTLFSQNSMILTEKLHTDSLLKWEWVYDVVGYYFRGTVNQAADGTVTANVDEYLRPVEYNYDLATYTSDAENAAENDEGQLVTVDGKTTKNQFLAQITAADGYAGRFIVGGDGVLADQNGRAVTPVGGYYPVYSDNEQKIWLYLCTKAEIENNTQWDTEFGAGTQVNEFQARITVTAQQIQQEAVMISNPTGLTDALNNAEGGVVRLESNMVISEAVKLNSDASVVLDLDGHEITYTGADQAFTLENGGALTVINGTVKGDSTQTNQKATAFYTMGGQITMSNLVIEDMYRGVNIEDQKTSSAQGANSFVKIVDCEITTEEISVKINGDGVMSGEDTHLVIQDSTIVSEGYIGIMGNGSSGNPGNWGTDIQIINSKVSGFYAGIYHPQQQSSLTISDSEISGFTGMAIKGGDVLVMNSTIKGTGTPGKVPTADMLDGNGFVDTGDAIYVETDYKQPITVTITGQSTVVQSTAGTVLRVFPEAAYVDISITGGIFKNDVSAYLTNGYSCTPNADGYYVVYPPA